MSKLKGKNVRMLYFAVWIRFELKVFAVSLDPKMTNSRLSLCKKDSK